METHANHPRNHCTPHYANELEFQTKVHPDTKKASWQWDIRTDVTTWSEQLYRIAGRDPETTLPSFKEHSASTLQSVGTDSPLLQREFYKRDNLTNSNCKFAGLTAPEDG